MAILIRRPNPIHLRRFHLTRSLLRDRRFVASVASILIAGGLMAVVITSAPLIRQRFHSSLMTIAYQLATSGQHTGWHTYTDRTDSFQVSVPCFAYTNPTPQTSPSPFGSISLRTTACLYSLGASDESFEIQASPLHYPADVDGQAAVLQQLAITREGTNASLTPATLNGAPAITTTLSGGNGRRYYTFNGGRLYLLTYIRPANAYDLGNRFLGSFRALN